MHQLSAIQQAAAKPACGTCAMPHGSASPTETQANTFENTVRSLLDTASQPQQEANAAVSDLVTGRTDDIHSVVVSVAKADLSFRFLVEMRNKLTEAYQEVMRMQM